MLTSWKSIKILKFDIWIILNSITPDADVQARTIVYARKSKMSILIIIEISAVYSTDL
jgi:hypothetical protein